MFQELILFFVLFKEKNERFINKICGKTVTRYIPLYYSVKKFCILRYFFRFLHNLDLSGVLLKIHSLIYS